MPKGAKGFQKGHKQFSSWRIPKGNTPWNKGKKTGSLSEEHREKISKAMAGKVGMDNNGYWKGGRTKSSTGYIMIHNPEHPASTKTGYVPEHRLVMEKNLGRYLAGTEVVHHINGVRDDNRLDNLMLFGSNSEHHKFHHLIKRK